MSTFVNIKIVRFAVIVNKDRNKQKSEMTLDKIYISVRIIMFHMFYADFTSEKNTF